MRAAAANIQIAGLCRTALMTAKGIVCSGGRELWPQEVYFFVAFMLVIKCFIPPSFGVKGCCRALLLDCVDQY